MALLQLLTTALVPIWSKICIKYRKHGSSSFSHTINFLNIDLKIAKCLLRGKIVVSLENYFWLPKSARSAQTVENSHRFFTVSYTWYKSLHLIIFSPVTHQFMTDWAEWIEKSGWIYNLHALIQIVIFQQLRERRSIVNCNLIV